MGLQKVVTVFIALAVITASASNHLTPIGKEAIYTWEALVKAGTNSPISHASQFIIDGKIHVQSDANSTHIKLTDLTYKLFNGILDHIHEHEAHSVPVQIPEMEHIFKVVYDTNGLAIGIVTNTHDKEFTRNIKKAIATIFQMDDSVLKQEHHHHPHSFVLKEQSIYGWFDTDYTVKHQENGDIEVYKLHDMKDPSHLYQNLFSNNPDCHCDMGYETAVMHISKKHYHIVKQDGHHIVKQINALGAVTYQPFKAQSDHQFILVNQTMTLVQVVPIQEQFHVQDEHFEDHLTYHAFTHSDDGIHDVTNGRHVSNYDKLIPEVQHILTDMHQYLQEDHIHTQEPDTKRGQAVNRVQRILQEFTQTKLEELHKKLKGDSLKTFYHILPLVGTKASTLFIKHLIVDKVVSDDVAVQMLQYLPEHVVEPTPELLSQLEELMHLDKSFHWNVRKSSILAFASLVHKSHVFSEKIHKNKEFDHHVPHTDNYSHQQPYEKYVVEYVNKFKTGLDYEVQQVYAFGLHNMKLHSIIHHVLPAVMGDWSPDNYHVRILGLWALSSAVITDKDHNTVIETLWPIMTDVDEITEMRILAFSFLTEKHLTESRLMNLFAHLINEPNEEVYRFAYTYVAAIMESNEPCWDEFKVRVAQIVKMLPPPTHGISFAQILDYKDVQFGFSSGVRIEFAHGNHSLMYGVSTTSQQFNVFHEDYNFYMKIHGGEHHGDPIKMLVDMFKKKTPKTSSEVHIEVAIIRHGQVINTYFLDKDNLHQLNNMLDFFTKDSQSLSEDLLQIGYSNYHQVVIPTDLGIPAVWDYLMPVVRHNNISMTKETVNKVINVHIDNKYVSWIHYRHGLSFYNIFADVWHGVNRYHSYDAVWPIHLDVTINTQQQSMQLSWKKHSNTQSNVAGMRSHVKQMVFVKDDHSSNALKQSSPHAEEFVIVTHGKQFRHDYTLFHDDDLSTGHQWKAMVYDSSRYVSNGSFSHLLHSYTESHPQKTDSPLDYLFKTYLNWHEYITLLPKPGTYGAMIRIEPSHHHRVSNIDLSLRLHSEPAPEDSYHYSPKIKWSTRMTYSVKNEEKSLKTWDMNAILDLNPGHTVNNLKMHMTRIIPGQKDYKICVDGIKKWTRNGVEGHLNVASSQTSDGKCVKDDTVIDVTVTGQHSQEQEEGHMKYGSCEHMRHYSLPHKHSMQCLVDHTSVRHYIYNVKTTNVPTEFRKTFEYWWDTIKGHYVDHYDYDDEHDEEIGEHNLKVDMEYPMQEEEVDVHITTPQHVYKLTGVPTQYWKWFGLTPDSLDYPEWFQYLHEVGYVDHCVIHVDHYHLNHHEEHQTVPKDWTLYVGNTAQNPQWAVYVKQVANDEIAMKIIDHDHTLEIVPHGANHQITMDGQVVPSDEYHHEDWGYFHVFIQDSHLPVAVLMQNSGIHVEYHHHQMVVVVPKEDQQLHGHCYDHQE